MLVERLNSPPPYPVYTAESLGNFVEAMQALAIPLQLASHTLLVTGTNGKSSACATLEALALQSGKRVATLTSPHLFAFHERLRVQGKPLGAGRLESLMQAHASVQQEFKLHPTDFKLLMMFKIISTLPIDWLILEVEVGFRFSPFNALKAELSIITGIDYDHLDLLGDHRESIAAEKAGVLRKGQMAVIADKAPPAALRSEIESLQVQAYWQDQGWAAYKSQTGCWILASALQKTRFTLPIPSLSLPSVGAAIVAWELLGAKLTEASLVDLMGKLELEGHFQRLPGEPLTLLDLASNPQAARLLFRRMLDLEVSENFQGWQVVCAMHHSSLIEESLMGLSFNQELSWHFPYIAEDFEPPAKLQQFFPSHRSQTVQNLTLALHQARAEAARLQQGVLAFGDVRVVSQALSILQPARAASYPPLSSANGLH